MTRAGAGGATAGTAGSGATSWAGSGASVVWSSSSAAKVDAICAYDGSLEK